MSVLLQFKVPGNLASFDFVLLMVLYAKKKQEMSHYYFFFNILRNKRTYSLSVKICINPGSNFGTNPSLFFESIYQNTE